MFFTKFSGGGTNKCMVVTHNINEELILVGVNNWCVNLWSQRVDQPNDKRIFVVAQNNDIPTKW